MIVEVVEPAKVTIEDHSSPTKSLLPIATGSSASLPPVASTCALLLLAIWCISRARRRANPTKQPKMKDDASPSMTSTATQTLDPPAHSVVPPPQAPSDPLPPATSPLDNQTSKLGPLSGTKACPADYQMSKIVTLIDTRASLSDSQTSKLSPLSDTKASPVDNQMSKIVTLIDTRTSLSDSQTSKLPTLSGTEIPPPDNQRPKIVTLIDTQAPKPDSQTSKVVPQIGTQVPPVHNRTTHRRDRMRANDAASCSSKASWSLLPTVDKSKETPVEARKIRSDVIYQKVVR